MLSFISLNSTTFVKYSIPDIISKVKIKIFPVIFKFLITGGSDLS